jgi:hypothetical protein
VQSSCLSECLFVAYRINGKKVHSQCPPGDGGGGGGESRYNLTGSVDPYGGLGPVYIAYVFYFSVISLRLVSIRMLMILKKQMKIMYNER